MKKISVVVPVYNEASFLRRCLESLAKQTEQAEVILVDDFSTDESWEICQEYEQKYGFRAYRHKKNKGVSAARNTGLDKVKTKWVTFLDADDELELDTIENMGRMGGHFVIYQFNQHRYYEGVGKKLCNVNPRGIYMGKRLPRQFCMVWNKLYETQFLNENQLRFREGMQYGEDEVFNLECLMLAKKLYHCSPVTIIRHFDNENSIVHTMNDKKILKQHEVLVDLYNKWQGRPGCEIIEGVIRKHYKTKNYTRLIKAGVIHSI